MAAYSTHERTEHTSAYPNFLIKGRTHFNPHIEKRWTNNWSVNRIPLKRSKFENNFNNRPRHSAVVTFSIAMSWFSILPAYLTVFETWIIRIFVCPTPFPSIPSPAQNPLLQLITPLLQLILGTVTIGPWLLVLTYDLVLYIFRALAYDIPIIGGRARGSQRPRAPSFAERPSGRARTFSIPGIGSTGNEDEEGVKWRSRDAKKQADLGREEKD